MKRVPLFLTVAAFSLMAFTLKGEVSRHADHHSSNLPTPTDIVSVTPNPTTDGTVTISNNDADEVHVYLFDEESTMLYQTSIKGKDKQVVKELKKGTLTYEVFKQDISIKQGKIISK